jgi:hypothetical protein
MPFCFSRLSLSAKPWDMSEQAVIPIERIAEKIYLIRGEKVMLDSDPAGLYGITTGNLNKAVKRNLWRFPEDFMFQLTAQEYEALKFQIGIANEGRGAGVQGGHFCYTDAERRMPFQASALPDFPLQPILPGLPTRGKEAAA